MKLTTKQMVERARLWGKYDDVLDLVDFELINGEWTVDGMDPDEWFEEMHGDCS